MGLCPQILGSDPSSAPSQADYLEGMPSPMSLKGYAVGEPAQDRGHRLAVATSSLGKSEPFLVVSELESEEGCWGHLS